MGMGVYVLWTRMLKPAWIHWALLPGTVISEMAYIFGCLITGGEIRRAKLLDAPASGDGRKRRTDGAELAAEATSRLRIAGPILAALISMTACGAAIVLAHSLLGEPVLRKFSILDGVVRTMALPESLPTSWEGLWDHLARQLGILRRMCETWGEVDWLDWRVPLFVYLAICLSVRLAPARRNLRFTLAAGVVIAGVIALAGAVSKQFTHLIEDVWPLLTYVYATVLFLLALTLLIRGMVLVVRALAGKGETA